MTSGDANSTPPSDPEQSDSQRPQKEAELLRGTPNQARMGPRARLLAGSMLGWSKDVHRPYLIALHSFQEAISALREMHQILGSELSNFEDTQFEADMASALKGLSPETKRLVVDFVSDAGPGLMTGSVFFSEPERHSKDGDESDEGSSSDESTTMESWQKVKTALGDNSGIAVDVLALAYRQVLGPDRAKLFRGLLLTSAISSLETLMTSLVRQYFLLNPGAMGEDPKFSLKQLQGFDSIDDARFEAATIKAEAVAGGDLNDWAAWMAAYPKIKLQTHCCDYNVLFEAFQRRHVLIHAGGRVSRRYKEKVEGVVGAAPDVGDYLDADEDYLDRAVDEVEIAGNLIASAVWAKVFSDQMPIITHQLYIRSYDLMLEKRWTAVKSLCEFAQVGKADADILMICKVNGLLACRELGDDINGHLNEWDISALDPRFQFAHVCLKNVPGEIAAQIPVLVEQGNLSWQEVLEWPLLDGFRRSAEFVELSQRFDKTAVMPAATSVAPDESSPS